MHASCVFTFLFSGHNTTKHSGTIDCAMLILASASLRRHELLRNAAIEFEIQPANVPEQRTPDEPPREYVERLAREKATAILNRNPGALVLGADTTVVVDEHVLEKPLDADDAVRMLRLLSGRQHQVITGVCLTGSANGIPFEDVRSQTTQVTLTALTEDEIRWYVDSGEPMDRAGAYAIQGMASRWAARIEGCYFNVVGLPVPLVVKMLKEASSRRISVL